MLETGIQSIPERNLFEIRLGGDGGEGGGQQIRDGSDLCDPRVDCGLDGV